MVLPPLEAVELPISGVKITLTEKPPLGRAVVIRHQALRILAVSRMHEALTPPVPSVIALEAAVVIPQVPIGIAPVDDHAAFG
ncbi:MAG: hypothetical protein IH614_12655, partial [Desulfuromonadales bacterium]|nr:hypothetical protein [Desulfuromonadales bacterium]